MVHDPTDTDGETPDRQSPGPEPGETSAVERSRGADGSHVDGDPLADGGARADEDSRNGDDAGSDGDVGADEGDDRDESAGTGEGTEQIIERELLNAAGEETAVDRPLTELRDVVDDDRPPGAAAERIPPDTLFELLAEPGNRFVLTYLIRADNPTTYADLVEYVVDRAEPPADTTDAKFRGRVAARLVHWNLPKLAEAGLIEHDTDEQTVTATSAIELVAPHLALAMSQSVVDDDGG